jgi:hypothetical protein
MIADKFEKLLHSVEIKKNKSNSDHNFQELWDMIKIPKESLVCKRS